MTDRKSSYRTILKSSSIIGGAAVINVLIGLVRLKVVAVLLGPVGIGLVGLLQNLMSTGSTVAAIGVGTAGTRQIAEATSCGDEPTVACARRALFWGTLLLAIFGGVAFWLLRNVLASEVLNDASMSTGIGWLALGVTLTVASGSQVAFLNGLRRIGSIAGVSVLSALLSTILGICAVALWGEQGILMFVLAGPFASFVLGHVFVARVPNSYAPPTPLTKLTKQWFALIRVGAAFMVAGFASTLGQFAVRTLVQRELGAEALGHFQAAWMISMTYIGFVLAAMGADYYPRLTAVIKDHAAVNRLVNEQSEVALMLAGPVFLAMLGLAPLVIKLLYSSQFNESIVVLRWQIFGDLLKVASWPIGFIILAAGDGRTFIRAEFLATAVFVGLSWFGIPIFGVSATGIAFLGMYAVLMPTVYWLAKRRSGFKWDVGVRNRLMLLILAALIVYVATLWSEFVASAVGLIAAMAFGIHSVMCLSRMTEAPGRLGKISNGCRNLMSGIRMRL